MPDPDRQGSGECLASLRDRWRIRSALSGTRVESVSSVRIVAQKGGDMIRVLTIDGDRRRAQALAQECLEQGVAVRVAETLCEGVRYLLEAPVSLVLAEASMLRMASADQARLFDTVAPGVPVLLTVDAG